MAYFNLKWKKITAPYEVIAVVPIDLGWQNVQLAVCGQFQVKSFLGAWYGIVIIGTDDAPQLAIVRPCDRRFLNNYQFTGTTLQLKNFDTGTWFSIVAIFDPPIQGFDPGVVPLNWDSDLSPTPLAPIFRIISLDTSDYRPIWIFDDQSGGLALAFDNPIPPSVIYRADTTILTADLITYTADYSY